MSIKFNKLGLLWLFPMLSLANSASLDEISVLDTVINNKANLSGLSSNVVLSKEKLSQTSSDTLGDALRNVTGVQNNYFGPNSGRPIIRGLSGQRVQIMQNDIPLQDMAAVSGNLATSANLASVKEIQIIKSGVASVLYGGKSIGGAVNLNNDSIPYTIAEKPFSGEIEWQQGFNALNTYKVQLKGNNKSHVAWYFDASLSEISSRKIPSRSKDGICYDYDYLKTNTELRRQCQVDIEKTASINPKYFKYISQFYLDNYKDPDYGLSEGDKYTNMSGGGKNKPNPEYVPGSPYYAEKFGPLTEYVPNLDGRIPNSQLRTKQITLGTSYIYDKGYIGAALSHFNTRYGVPGFAYLTSRTPTKRTYLPISVTNETNRLNVKGIRLSSSKLIAKAELHLNFQKSHDKEWLGTHLSNGLKSYSDYYRLSFDHQPLFNHHLVGSFGTEWNKQKVMSSGKDSYLPNVNTDTKGLFVLEKIEWSPFVIEIGQRWDKVKYVVDTTNRITSGGKGGAYSKSRAFLVQNSHAGFLFQPMDAWYLRLQRSWQERAPEINELYADNNHYALLIEENGDGRLKNEKSRNWEISTGINWEQLSAELTWFRRDFSQFNYLGYTGISRSGLVVKEWRQAPLQMNGLELDLTYQHSTNSLGDFTWHFFTDYVQNKLKLDSNHIDTKRIGYLPYLPTSRVGGDLTVQWQRWKSFASIVHYLKQKRVTKEVDDELPVKNFTLVDLGLSYVYPLNQAELEVSFHIQNLTNREARLNNSQLRFLAPLPGRNARLGVKLMF
ncbi:TonB-dependent receptor, beta-barrel domain protein [Pasteurella multocida]|nr:TonB-dependent receptor, beta-barrel domain protein [Pasteurella multocida]